jgi:MFS family permease
VTIDAPAGEAGRPQEAVPAPPAIAQTSSAYRTYTLFVLTLIYVVNYLDRQILGILLPMIQKEFSLNGTEQGLISGTVFAVVYATLGIPVAIFADRLNRRNIIAGSLAVFSLMTVLCGYAANAWQLALARFGTGIGEAGTGPSINAMIGDLYPPEKRASALAFYSAGLNIGLLLGFFGGGWIAAHYGWRRSFLAAGVPGLLLVFLLLATVREPRRGAVEHLVDDANTPPLWAVVRHLWSQVSFRWIAIGTSFSAFGGYAGLAFIPSFLKLSHHLTVVQYSIVLALLTGGAGAFGTYFAGVFADHFGKRDVKYNMYVPIVSAFISLPFGLTFYLMPAHGTAFVQRILPAFVTLPLPFGLSFTVACGTAVVLAAAFVPALTGATYLGPAYAMTQRLVPLRMRAQAIAILLFVLNMIALGLGPLTVGFLSDVFQPIFGADSLGRALLIATVSSGLIGAFCYWRSTATLKADLARMGQVQA